ncbi:aKG-HExxH-type peptide beta-hydroxylase [Cryptosporangium japonicum]|uniref:aKG-HExxH-type peptide beta-hydroxylase n=1 Tax=Cryptosporangium japonicum TaxID=80872 RepID=UPI0031D01AB9
MTNDLIRTPAIGNWLMQCVSHHRAGATDALERELGYLGAVAAAACFHAALPFETTARTRDDGSLMVPGLGLLVVADGPEWVRLRGSGGDSIDVVGRAVIGPDEPETDRWKPLRRLRSEAHGLSIELILDDVDPYRGHYLPPVTGRLAPAELTRWRQLFDTAWEIITRQPEQALALRSGFRSLVPLEPDDRAPFVSATTRDAVGAAGITCRTGDALAEALVHEYQHSVLWALLDVVDLVEDDPTPSFYAPWRSDPRPGRGLLHGAFAFHGLLRYWAARATSDPGPAGRVAAFELALWRIGVRTVIRQLADSTLLTAEGVALVDGMHATLDEMVEHPVPADLQRSAEAIALDLWTTWRLRNRRPDPAEIRSCCAAWTTGSARPPIGGWTLVDEGSRVAGTPRLALLRRRLAGGMPEADTTANTADVHWIDGDLVRAATLYATALDDADDPSASWSGLLLAWHLLNRPYAPTLLEFPEHVRATFECIERCSGYAPELTRFADWFSRGESQG